MIDPGFQYIANIGIYFWMIGDYASDLLVLKLAPSSIVESLCNITAKEEDSLHITILCLSLYSMMLKLYAINSNKLDMIHRIPFLWSFMIWMISASNIYVVTKRNIVVSVIGIVLMITGSDVSHPMHTIYEPC